MRHGHKGTNIAGIDRFTGSLSRLFNPRIDTWDQHFAWNGAILVGVTPIGRATVEVLAFNLPIRVSARAVLIEEGVFPPK